MKTRYAFIALLCLLALPALACSLPRLPGAGSLPAVPSRDVSVSEAAAQQLEDKVDNLRNLQGDDLRLIITESEITSLINVRLAQEARTVPVQNLHVWFEPGQMILSGRLQAEGIPVSGTAVVVMALEVTDGQLSVDIRQAGVGAVPVPDVVLSSLRDLINATLPRVDSTLSIVNATIRRGEVELSVRR